MSDVTKTISNLILDTQHYLSLADDHKSKTLLSSLLIKRAEHINDQFAQWGWIPLRTLEQLQCPITHPLQLDRTTVSSNTRLVHFIQALKHTLCDDVPKNISKSPTKPLKIAQHSKRFIAPIDFPEAINSPKGKREEDHIALTEPVFELEASDAKPIKHDEHSVVQLELKHFLVSACLESAKASHFHIEKKNYASAHRQAKKSKYYCQQLNNQGFDYDYYDCQKKITRPLQHQLKQFNRQYLATLIHRICTHPTWQNQVKRIGPWGGIRVQHKQHSFLAPHGVGKIAALKPDNYNDFIDKCRTIMYRRRRPKLSLSRLHRANHTKLFYRLLSKAVYCTTDEKRKKCIKKLLNFEKRLLDSQQAPQFDRHFNATANIKFL